MNYGEFRTHFKNLLNRDDCSDELADQFIGMGLRRTERLLRTPFQLSSYKITVGPDFDGRVTIPNDFLGLSEVRLDDLAIRRTTQDASASFDGYYLQDQYVILSPIPTEGTTVELSYYREFTQGVDDDALTNYVTIIPDMILYASLVWAGDYFLDSRSQAWEMKTNVLAAEIQGMADEHNWAGGGFAIVPQGGGLI